MRSLAIVLLAAVVGLLVIAPVASAQEASCTQILERGGDQRNGSAGPGGILADAIGDQRDAIGEELENGSFRARLDNATSTRERAGVVAEEVDRIEANVSTLERCWGINGTEPAADRTLAELDGDERELLANRSRALRDRLNETRAAAERLPQSLRETHDVQAERFASLEQRILIVRNATSPERSPSDRPLPIR